MPKNKKQRVITAHQMTRGQMSRYQREQQQQRILYYSMGAVALVVLLLFAWVGLNELVLKPAAQAERLKKVVATVGDTQITRATYNKLQAWQLFNQIRIQAIYGSQGLTGSGTDPATQIAALQQQLVNLPNTDAVDNTVLENLTNNTLLAQQAGSLGVTVSDDDIKTAALKDFEPQPTPIPQPTTPPPSPTATPATVPPTATPTVTGTPPPTLTRTPTATDTPGPSHTPTTTPTITNTPIPVPGAAQTATADYAVFIRSLKNGSKPIAGDPFCDYGCPGLSEQEYLDLVAKPQLLQKRVTEELQKQIPTTGEQVHVAHILFMVKSDQNTEGTHTDDEAHTLAQQTLDRLNKGEDFATLAGQLSEDTSNKDKGGDLGFFLPTEKGGPMVQPFSDAAFKLTKTGELSLIKTQFGWHILKLLERGDRPLTASDVETAKNAAYTKWLDEQKQKVVITLNGVALTPVPPTSVPVPTEPPLPAVTNAPITSTNPLSGTNPVTSTGTITK
jgi:parvulin-like peptidyl-prolyl isomerase